jgi:cytochrome P450
VASIRRRLELQRGGAAVSDDDVARNLIGIITGSLTATAKSFGEGLSSFASRSHDPTGRIAWDGATCHGSSAPSYPLYERVIARSMQAEHRGAPDSLYRKYVGPDCSRSGQILKAGDTVVVWLGNGVHGDSERLFGVGVHKCPGKDMGKALMEGMLQTLSSLQGDDSPRISDMGGEAGLTFDHPEALVALANQR